MRVLRKDVYEMTNDEAKAFRVMFGKMTKYDVLKFVDEKEFDILFDVFEFLVDEFK